MSKSGEIERRFNHSFTETGIVGDVINAWTLNHARALNGKFDQLGIVQHYAEYFLEQDKKYEEVGKPGLFKAVMEGSDPKTVAAFDQLVDEFNGKLSEIMERRDSKEIQAYLKKVEDLKRKPHEISTSEVV